MLSAIDLAATERRFSRVPVVTAALVWLAALCLFAGAVGFPRRARFLVYPTGQVTDIDADKAAGRSIPKHSPQPLTIGSPSTVVWREYPRNAVMIVVGMTCITAVNLGHLTFVGRKLVRQGARPVHSSCFLCPALGMLVGGTVSGTSRVFTYSVGWFGVWADTVARMVYPLILAGVVPAMMIPKAWARMRREADLCPACAYPLRGLLGPRCPECDTHVEPALKQRGGEVRADFLLKNARTGRP